MNVAVITLSDYGVRLARRLVEDFPEWRVYVHEIVGIPFDDTTLSIEEAHCGTERRGNPPCPSLAKGGEEGILKGRPDQVERFSRIADLTAELFHQYEGLVYIAPCGVVVRALAPHLRHKTTDPAVVAVDAGGRWAISLLSGHEGGANDLAVAVANCLGAEPVISTTTEAVKRLIVGIGCRRGIDAQTIILAVKAALRDANVDLTQVRMLASADVKRNEHGLHVAAKELGIPLRFIKSAEIRECLRSFEASRFVEDQVNVPAVAEPCALLAGRRTRLLAPKRIHNGVTVAVAEESSLSWE